MWVSKLAWNEMQERAFSREEAERARAYATCLEVVLKKGGLSDAETMCGYMRERR